MPSMWKWNIMIYCLLPALTTAVAACFMSSSYTHTLAHSYGVHIYCNALTIVGIDFYSHSSFLYLSICCFAIFRSVFCSSFQKFVFLFFASRVTNNTFSERYFLWIIDFAVNSNRLFHLRTKKNAIFPEFMSAIRTNRNVWMSRVVKFLVLAPSF